MPSKPTTKVDVNEVERMFQSYKDLLTEKLSGHRDWLDERIKRSDENVAAKFSRLEEKVNESNHRTESNDRDLRALQAEFTKYKADMVDAIETRRRDYEERIRASLEANAASISLVNRRITDQGKMYKIVAAVGAGIGGVLVWLASLVGLWK